MFSVETKKEIKKMAVGILALTVIMVAAFALAGFFSMGVVYGAALGAGFAFLNFFLLALSVQKAASSSPKAAQGTMGASYLARYFLTGAVVVLGIKLPVFNYLAVVIPLIFPRIIITLGALFASRNIKKGE